jgi:hypothetical protein
VSNTALGPTVNHTHSETGSRETSNGHASSSSMGPITHIMTRCHHFGRLDARPLLLGLLRIASFGIKRQRSRRADSPHTNRTSSNRHTTRKSTLAAASVSCNTRSRVPRPTRAHVPRDLAQLTLRMDVSVAESAREQLLHCHSTTLDDVTTCLAHQLSPCHAHIDSSRTAP